MAKENNWSFVEVKIGREDKQLFQDWTQARGEVVTSMIETLCSYGYKVSVSWVDSHNSFVVSVSGSDSGKLNKQCTMTSWSDDVIEAFQLAVFKVVHVTGEGVWSDYATEKDNWG